MFYASEVSSNGLMYILILIYWSDGGRDKNQNRLKIQYICFLICWNIYFILNISISRKSFWVLANIIMMYMFLFKLLMTRFKANHNTLLYDDVDWRCKQKVICSVGNHLPWTEDSRRSHQRECGVWNPQNLHHRSEWKIQWSKINMDNSMKV